MSNLLNRALLCGFATLVFSFSWSAAAQDFEWAPDFPVGASIPLLEAADQNGTVQTFDSLKGEKGLALFFNRSFDWCPFCKAELASLAAASDEFEALGLAVAAMTYDPVETLKLVEEDMGIDFTLLHDEEVKHVNAFNILNTRYEPGHSAYGIPLPGIMLIDADGVIRHKFSEENYRDRPDLAEVLAAAATM